MFENREDAVRQLADRLSDHRGRHPLKLVCAVPVASREALATIQPMADEVVCLHAPDAFGSVGQWYRDFPQVSDEEVIALLRG